MTNLDDAFDWLLKFEGGYSDDPLDKGGKTRYGITESLARDNGYAGEMSELSFEKAKDIYLNVFWNPMRLWTLDDQRVANELFEYAVNAWIPSAVRAAQRAVNLFREVDLLDVDGKIGPLTIAALNAFKGRDILSLLKAMNCLQFVKYYDITDDKPKQKRFIKSWLRRVHIQSTI